MTRSPEGKSHLSGVGFPEQKNRAGPEKRQSRMPFTIPLHVSAKIRLSVL